MQYRIHGEIEMEENFYRADGWNNPIPQEIMNKLHCFMCFYCHQAFLASTCGGEKYATDIDNLKFCPHCGKNLYEPENENRTIESENRTIHSE